MREGTIGVAPKGENHHLAEEGKGVYAAREKGEVSDYIRWGEKGVKYFHHLGGKNSPRREEKEKSPGQRVFLRGRRVGSEKGKKKCTQSKKLRETVA